MGIQLWDHSDNVTKLKHSNQFQTALVHLMYMCLVHSLIVIIRLMHALSLGLTQSSHMKLCLM
jgi:hypothetical protein